MMTTTGLHDSQAQATHLGLVATKVPPSYNGLTSWFEYEGAVLDLGWDSMTELSQNRRALALNKTSVWTCQ